MISSGSGLERFFACRASNVLHRTFDEAGTEDNSRGMAVHGHLQRLGEGMSLEASLDEVDEAHRTAAAQVDVESISDIIGMTPELALAYHPDSDTARVLGVGIDREYSAAGVTDDEIPLTLDVAGLDNPSAPRIGATIDYKTGWGRLVPAERNWQMRGGSLALARAYDLDEVRTQLVTLRDNMPARRDRATFTSADLGMFAAQARAQMALVRADRAEHAQTGRIPDATSGSWCQFCPSYNECPAKTALVRAAIGGELGDSIRLGLDNVAEAFRRLREVRGPLKALERAIYAAARERPVLIETLPDGQQVWLGLTETVGVEKFDAAIARTVVKEMLDDAAVDEVSKFEVGKGRLEAAVKLRVPKGQGAGKYRAITDEIRKRNGVHQNRRHEVDLYKLQPGQLAPAKAG